MSSESVKERDREGERVERNGGLCEEKNGDTAEFDVSNEGRSTENFSTISLSSDESDEEDESPRESSIVNGPKLIVVYDVEYRAPE